MDFVNFLLENWKVFAVVAAILIELILVLVFKRRPTIIDTSIFFRVASWIEYAEKHFVIGSEKLDYVLSEAKKYLGDNYDENHVKNLVEWILSLPQRKDK